MMEFVTVFQSDGGTQKKRFWWHWHPDFSGTLRATWVAQIARHIQSITESVYTHIEMSELIKAIDSVYYPEEIIKEVKKSKKKSEHC